MNCLEKTLAAANGYGSVNTFFQTELKYILCLIAHEMCAAKLALVKRTAMLSKKNF